MPSDFSNPPRFPANARPARAPVVKPADFALLDQTHQGIARMLQALTQMLDHMQDGGPDEQARALAADVHAFFQAHVRQHHAEEEKHVFPGLLANGDAELVQHVERLQQDHRWLEEDWNLLAPQIEAIANGYNWYDLPMLTLALPVFVALNEEHVLLEETVVYPAAMQLRKRLAS